MASNEHNVQYMSVITNRNNNDNSTERSGVKNRGNNSSHEDSNSSNNNSNDNSNENNNNSNDSNKDLIQDDDTDEEEMLNKEQKNLPPKSNRLQVASEYYKISMVELRSYENLLRIFVLASLKRIGVCVIENFLPETFADGVESEIGKLYSSEKNLFKPPVESDDYRGDHVYWIGTNAESEQQCDNIKKLERYFHQLILSMVNHEKQRGNVLKITHKSRTQISCFKAGEIGYKPHIDNPNSNGRLLSVTYYCNKNYTRIEDGGLVRFYLNNNTKYIELEPKYNTAVVHWSDRRVIKEVLPSTTHKNLFHLSSWFFGTCSDTGSKRRLGVP